MSVVNESAQEIITERLSKLVDLIDKNENVYTFKVKKDIPEIKEKLILAGQEPTLEYITIIMNSRGFYEYIKWFLKNGETYSATGSEMKVDVFSDKCRYTSKIVWYFCQD